MKRREFIHITAAAAAGAALFPPAAASVAAEAIPSAARLPRWRGFNLTDKTIARKDGNGPFVEADFEMMQEWGFDFARLPLSYLCWSSSDNQREVREPELKHLDAAVELGRKHKVHVNLNLHRAPGYCVNPPAKPNDLWRDEQALENCAFQWAMLARRFKGVPNDRLSFDLLNEPKETTEENYVRIVRRLVGAIRAEDPQRLIIADGMRWGRDPVFGIADLGVAQSTRGYDPMPVSHWRARWVEGSDKWPEPTWPLELRGKSIDKDFLRRDRIEPWLALAKKGVGIHVGEWGAYRFTPHKVVLAWMTDQLSLWKDAGWGWALWNFRGDFGVLNSNRQDVAYEDFRGLRLDREMLKLLQAW